MYSIRLHDAVFAATLLGQTIAQAQNGNSKIVPQDLQSGFSDQVQVSYTGDADNGFVDGTTFGKNGMFSLISL